MRASRLAAVAAATLLFVCTSNAHAEQPSRADRETARSLMDEGDKKRDAGDLKGALKSYEAADAIMKVPTTGIEVARTQVALGLLLEARETLGAVLRSPSRPNEPAPFVSARRAADALNNELSARIPSILVVVTNLEAGQPAHITVDNEPIPPAAANVPRKVNPGPHVIVVRSGSLKKDQEVSVAERESKTLTIDLKDQPAAAMPKERSPAAAPKRADEGTSASTILMVGGFGVAVIGVGVGSVTGLMSISKTNELKGACPDNHCTPDKQGEIDSATSLGTISTIAFIAGGVGLGVGLVGLLTSGSDAKEASLPRSKSPFTPERMRAVLGPSYVGVAGAF